MPCYYPLQAWQTAAGEVVFAESAGVARELTLPCGRCIGCRVKRARNWAVRCMHESQMHEQSMFVTLTYDDRHYSPSIDYKDFQLFMKRVRRRMGATRFFAVGEYGEDDYGGVNRYMKTFSGVDSTLLRPHFHALLFGQYFNDRKKIGMAGDKPLWRSPTLEELWPHGNSSFGDVTFQSAGYCAQYAVKKINGSMAEEHYTRCDPDTGELVRVAAEVGHMSLKPGIGYTWFQKYWKDVYAARDCVVIGGRSYPAPRYYDKLLSDSLPDLANDKEYERYIESEKFKEDCTPERLLVREAVEKARINIKKRKL